MENKTKTPDMGISIWDHLIAKGYTLYLWYNLGEKDYFYQFKKGQDLINILEFGE